MKSLQEVFSLENPACHICKSQIEDLPFRFLIVQDKFQNEIVLGFHYFYPCWDVSYICQNLPGLKILKAGFCYDESILKNPSKIKNIKRNYELWDL